MASKTEKFKRPPSIKELKKSKLVLIVAGLGLGAVVGFFFFRDWPFCVLCAIGGAFFVPHELKDFWNDKAKAKISKEFVLFTEKVSTALSAGRSLESAILFLNLKDASVQKNFPETGAIIKKMQQDLRSGVKVENAFIEMANAIHLNEARDLGDVLCVAQKAGGNLAAIFRESERLIRERMAVENEIRVQIMRQKIEQGLLFLMPFVIIGLLLWMSPSYVMPLYETLIGRIVMTSALGVMLLCYWLSKKLSDIKV